MRTQATRDWSVIVGGYASKCNQPLQQMHLKVFLQILELMQTLKQVQYLWAASPLCISIALRSLESSLIGTPEKNAAATMNTT